MEVVNVRLPDKVVLDIDRPVVPGTAGLGIVACEIAVVHRHRVLAVIVRRADRAFVEDARRRTRQPGASATLDPSQHLTRLARGDSRKRFELQPARVEEAHR